MSTGSHFTKEEIANHGKSIYKTLETYGFEHNWSNTKNMEVFDERTEQ
jgi:hypothetical protein